MRRRIKSTHIANSARSAVANGFKCY